MIEEVQAELAPAYGHVVAGKSVEVAVRVRNLGETIADLGLDMQGRLGRWADITPSRLRLFPGENGAARITFQIPRDGALPVGPMPYAVTVTSWPNGALSTVVFGRLTIDAARSPGLEITPATAHGRFTASYRITVVNDGPRPLEGHLLASDPDQVLRFDTSAILVRVAPRTRAQTLIHVRPRRVNWGSPPIEHRFHVLLQPRQEDALHVQAVLRQLPVLPRRAV